MSDSYLAHWIAKIDTGHVITEDDMATLARIRLALHKADQHHRQAREAQATLEQMRDELKHETQWADAAIDSVGFWQQQRDELASELSLSRLAHQEQDKRLAAVEAERDALEMSLAKKAESYRASVLAAEAETKQWKEFFYAERHRAERAERVVEALREPSEAALRGASDVIFAELGFTLGEGKIRRILHYAVEAVEKEAQP